MIFLYLTAFVTATAKRISLSFDGGDSALCLVRSPGIYEQQVITIPCQDVYEYGLAASTWIEYPDGRIRGTNGLCLHYTPKYPSFLVAERCSRSPDEKWTVDDGILSCPLLASRPAARLPEQRWLEVPIVKQPFDEALFLKLHKAKEAQRFRELPNQQTGNI